jgi:hypothetical protein
MDREQWHLDKRVPISLIITLLAQTVAIVWWAAAIEGRVSVLEVNIIAQEVEINHTIEQLNSLNTTMTRVDTTLGFVLQELRKEE